jgi:hypothetical protein
MAGQMLSEIGPAPFRHSPHPGLEVAVPRRALPVLLRALAGAVVTALAVAAPAAGAELLRVTPDGCASVVVSGTDLPVGERVTIVLRDARTRRELARATATTTQDGALETALPARLGVVATIEAELRAGGRPVITATTDRPGDQLDACDATASALPFDGPARTLTLIGGAALLLGLGFLVRSGAGYRGRHRIH